MRSLSITVILVVSATHIATVQSSAQPTAPQPPAPQPTVYHDGLPPAWLEAWTGLTFSNSFVGGYAGAVRALNQSNSLETDGFVLRWEGLVGQYSINTHTDSDVDLHGASMMFGYRATLGTGIATAYIGPDYQSHNTPDRNAEVRGLEAGLKGLVEYYTPLGPNVFFYGQGWYSSAFDTYFAFGQVGYRIFDRIWIGPETSLFGNEAPYRENRIGAFIKFDVPWAPLSQISVSGGYRNALTSGSADGYYVNVYLGYGFH